MPSALQRALITAALFVAVALPAAGQMQVGENTSLNLTGNLSFNYSGNYSNLGASSHGFNPGGNADLNGYYYSPSFLSFDVQPFYGYSQESSSYRSVFQSTGVSGSASIFSGSRFPGTINYSRVHNGEGSFAIPGVGDFKTHGNSEHISLGWGIHFPDYPTVSVLFGDGNSNQSVLGAEGQNEFHNKTFGVSSSYSVAGFNLNGGYHRNSSHGSLPQFLAGEPAQKTEMSSNSYNFGLSHLVPLHGSASVGVGRSVISSGFSGDKFHGTIDTVNGGVGFAPVRNLDVGVSSQYTNNLNGMLYEPLINSGTVVPSSLLRNSTHSLDISSHANYQLPLLHLMFMAREDHRVQSMLGTSVSSDSLFEAVNYGNSLLGGFVNATMTVNQTTVNFDHGSKTLGFLDSVSYNRSLRGWNLTGAFNYSRNTQTILVGLTSSGYGYGIGVGHKLSPYSFVSFNASGSKSSFSGGSSGDNFAQSYSSSLSMKRFSVSGTYTKTNGNSLLTSEGLVPITNPSSGTLPLQAFGFGGTSYSFGASTTPKRGLVLSGIYSIARSTTTDVSVASHNRNAQLNTLLEYRVRQLWITGGYIKFQQGFSITGQPAASDSAFFIGISRWFKFF